MTADAKPAPGAGLSYRGRTIALWVVLLAFFMDLLDTTIVNVAIPSIQTGLGASYSSIQWIIAGYSLTFALFLITGGRLGDIFGYKRLFLAGITGFIVASLLSGLAQSTGMLIGARLLQGFFAAMMVPQILSLIQVMYTTSEERAGVSAFYGALAGVATVGGPIIGALLISGNVFGFGWRTIFLVNLPVGIAAIILAAIYLPNAKSSHPLKLDIVGVALVVLAMLLLMYPLIQGRELDWPAWTFISMIASVPVFIVFAFSQVWKQRRDGSPLVVPQFFTKRSFVAGIALSGSFFAIVTGFFLIFTLFLQIGLGYSVLKAGLTGIPFSIGVSVAAGMSGPVFVPRFGRNIITVGPVTMAAGFALFIWTVNAFGADVTPYELIPALLIAGVGMGFVVASVYPFILAEVPLKDAGSASGIINAVGQIGGAIGIAAIGVIFFGVLASQSTASVDSVRSDLTADLTAAGLPAFAIPNVVTSFETCFHDRASAKDFSDVPQSCKDAQAAQAAFAASAPAIAKIVGDAVGKRALEANQRNFTTAISRALEWEIGALVFVFFLSFLLPRRPRDEKELAAAGVAAA
ncbi:MAG TPA: MFS transporter [Bauldia sp.]|nr:MFS transporter [Bauldia sp.]